MQQGKRNESFAEYTPLFSDEHDSETSSDENDSETSSDDNNSGSSNEEAEPIEEDVPAQAEENEDNDEARAEATFR